MPVNVERLLERIEALERDVKQLYRMLLDLREAKQGSNDTVVQTQTTTVNWWRSWRQEEEQ